MTFEPRPLVHICFFPAPASLSLLLSFFLSSGLILPHVFSRSTFVLKQRCTKDWKHLSTPAQRKHFGRKIVHVVLHKLTSSGGSGEGGTDLFFLGFMTGHKEMAQSCARGGSDFIEGSISLPRGRPNTGTGFLERCPMPLPSPPLPSPLLILIHQYTLAWRCSHDFFIQGITVADYCVKCCKVFENKKLNILDQKKSLSCLPKVSNLNRSEKNIIFSIISCIQGG